MTDRDWYRGAEWDEAARDEFERRLRRARAHSRPQYLRIKAFALRAAGENDGAVALCERVLAQPGEFPNFEVPPTLELLGDIARERRDFDTAEYHYRRVLTEWDRPQGTSGMVRIKLADVLAGRGDPHRRREARQLIADHLADPFTVRLPSAMFALYIARARLAAAEGDSVGVREAAQAALGLIDSPPVVKHKPWFGAVQATPEVLARLARVAESGTFDA